MASKGHKFDHVVAVMFENRSFDNLLGYLYQPGEVPSFEGVAGRELSNPIPDYAPGAERKVVPVHPAKNMNTPNPDPGEEFPHINTQLFGAILPDANRAKTADKMVPPFNLEGDPGRTPTMDGFVLDYISAIQAETGKLPDYDMYSQIMACYTPEQLPVTSAIARGFATFDHWFCEVPSQTFTNRSFYHAGTASGFVVNAPYDNFPLHNNAETIFERLEAAGLPWRIYVDPDNGVSFTAMIHNMRLGPYFASHFYAMEQFYEDAAQGKLPAYSFIEPNFLHAHNDMHPPMDAVSPGFTIDPPSSMLGGEALMAKIYDAVRTSSAPDGSNYANTLLLIAFDEHGGTFDHVPPPPAVPPTSSSAGGQFGFGFDRSGVRIPTIAVSAYVDERTVINDEYRNTSLIRTLRERWPLGEPLTARDASAPDIAPILTRETPRPQAEWPEVFPQPVPDFDATALPLDQRLPPLGQYLLGTALVIEKARTGTAPAIDPKTCTAREAIGVMFQLQAEHFPNIAAGRAKGH